MKTREITLIGVSLLMLLGYSFPVFSESGITIQINPQDLTPAEITVNVGETITWINNDSYTYKIRPEQTYGLPMSFNFELQPKEQVSHTFTENPKCHTGTGGYYDCYKQKFLYVASSDTKEKNYLKSGQITLINPALKEDPTINITTDKQTYLPTENVFITIEYKNLDGLLQVVLTHNNQVIREIFSETFTYLDSDRVTTTTGQTKNGQLTESVGDYALEWHYQDQKGSIPFSVVAPTPSKPISLLDIRVADQSGIPLDVISTGQMVVLQSNIKSNESKEQSFVYIIQVKNSDGITTALSWTKGEIAPEKMFNMGISWIPDKTGTYHIDIFVWQSIEQPIPLLLNAPSKTVTVI